MELLGTQNAKTTKGEKQNYLTGILYLSPADESGIKNLCPKASEQCKADCLYTAGMGNFESVKAGRLRKTLMLLNEPAKFFSTLESDIQKLVKRAKNKGMTACVRINGTSDMPSIARRMAKKFPDVQFYDYTKLPKPESRVLPNYHLTFSRSEDNWADCENALKNGVNVAVVFQDVPKTYKGYKVINGDETDLRFLDPKGVIVGLKAKGKARKRKGGFVV